MTNALAVIVETRQTIAGEPGLSVDSLQKSDAESGIMLMHKVLRSLSATAPVVPATGGHLFGYEVCTFSRQKHKCRQHP